MRRSALAVVLAIVASACSEALAPQPIPPPDLSQPAQPTQTLDGERKDEEEDTRRAIEPAPAVPAGPPAAPTAASAPPPTTGEAAARALALLLGDPEETRFVEALLAASTGVNDRGPTPHSSASVSPRVPTAETRITSQGAVRARLDNGLGMRARSCGPGDGYIVVCPPEPDPAVLTDYYVMTMTLEAPVPAKGAPGIYTYAFVLDADGKAENNFKPEPAFPNDFYKDTDTWYELTKAANGDFLLEIWLQSLGAPQKRSGARALLKENAIMLVIPAKELPSGPAGYRMTAFRHTGDFGMQGEWSGDTSPRVGEPLRTFTSFSF